jgi:cellulose 1,4-beta-cellobiosidase
VSLVILRYTYQCLITGRENSSDISKIDSAAEDVPCKNILGLVLAGLPFKSCDLTEGELGVDPWNYIEDFIDPIVRSISRHPNTAFAIILEPGIVANYALQPEAECDHVRDVWYSNVPRALKALDLPNVIMYLDGAHGGIFGWTGRTWQGTTSVVPEWFHGDEGSPIRGATEFTATWQAAGPLSQFRGLAVNVRNYNAW